MYLKSKSFLNFYIFQVIPDYFAATVLQRSSPEYPQVCYNLEIKGEKSDSLPNFQPAFGNLKFQVAFNLVVIWMIVFICLSKGWDFDDAANDDLSQGCVPTARLFMCLELSPSSASSYLPARF